MEEIDILDLLKYLKSKIVILLVTFVIVSFCSYIVLEYCIKTTYSATTTILVLKNDNTYNTENVVDNYVQILRSNKILNQVADNLKGLNGEIDIIKVENTDVIEITFKSHEKDILDSTIDEFIAVSENELKDIYSEMNISVVDKSDITVNFTMSVKIVLSIFIGLLSSLIFVFGMYVIKIEKLKKNI